MMPILAAQRLRFVHLSYGRNLGTGSGELPSQPQQSNPACTPATACFAFRILLLPTSGLGADDKVDQAAWWAGISMTSMPFWNLTPWTTFDN